MDPAPSTDGDLQGSKSIVDRSQRGLQREQQAMDYLKKQGYVIIAHRLMTPFAEVDLLAKDRLGDLHLFEVKGPRKVYYPVIQKKQFDRLCRACVYLQGLHGRPVRFHLALVDLTKVEVHWDLSLNG